MAENCIDEKAHAVYQDIYDRLAALVADRDTAYRIIWGSVAALLIVMSDPDKSQVEMLGAVMARIDGGTLYDMDIWWPIRALYQRDKNADEFSKSYTADDLVTIDEAADFEKQYGFGFRTGFAGSFWRRLFRQGDTPTVDSATAFIRAFTDEFYPQVRTLVDRYGDKLLYRGDARMADSADGKYSAFLNTIKRLPSMARAAIPEPVSKPKKSFEDFLKARENEN